IKINELPYTVIGVRPKGFSFPQAAELWVPLVTTNAERSDRSQHSLFVTTRLRPGVSVHQAQAEMDGIARRMGATYPKTNQGWGVHVIPVSIFVTGELTRSYTLILLGSRFCAADCLCQCRQPAARAKYGERKGDGSSPVPWRWTLEGRAPGADGKPGGWFRRHGTRPVVGPVGCVSHSCLHAAGHRQVSARMGQHLGELASLCVRVQYRARGRDYLRLGAGAAEFRH